MPEREPVAAGRFYPASPDELQKEIEVQIRENIKKLNEIKRPTPPAPQPVDDMPAAPAPKKKAASKVNIDIAVDD